MIQPTLLPEKLKWEWRRVKHSVSIKKREKYVGDLRHWNQDLKGCLEKSEVPAEDESQKVRELKRRFDPKRCDALRQSLNSLHAALSSAFTCDCVGLSHEAAIDLDWVTYEMPTNPIKVAVFSKAETRGVDVGDWHVWRRLHAAPEETPASSEISRQPLLAPEASPDPAACPKPPLKSKSVQFAMFRTHIQTSSTASVVTATTMALKAPAVSPEPAGLVTDICAAICSGHVSSKKRGHIKDPSHGRHFSIWDSQEQHSVTEKIPIKSLLSRSRGSPHLRRWPMLSAKQRYGLAVAIAWSVLHMGDSPWLKDLWDQDQIGVFVENRNRHEVLCRYPCASHIFGLSNTGGASTASTEPLMADKFYSHVSHKNIFLLGVLLVELCINEPITGSGSILEVNGVAQGKLEEVRCTAGDMYGNAAERCIKFAFDGRESYRYFSFSTFRQQFHDVVLAPIMATYFMFPDTL